MTVFHEFRFPLMFGVVVPKLPPGASLSSAIVVNYGAMIRKLREITNHTANKEPKWRHNKAHLTTGYEPRWRA